MPFPANYEEMETAGYRWLRMITCESCGESVEIFSTPGKRELGMVPMCLLTSKAVKHFEICQPKEETNGKAIGGLGEDLHSDPREQRNGPEETERSVRNDGATGPDINSGRVLGRQSSINGKHSQASLPMGGRDDEGSAIKLYGVTDKNMIAVGWSEGTLKVQFRFGAYLYSNVAEDAFLKIKANPFPNALFTKIIKSKPELYPCTKVS
jgi:hypothetical protein